MDYKISLFNCNLRKTMNTHWYYGLLQHPKLKMAAIMVAKIPLAMLTKNGYRFGALETNPKFKTSWCLNKLSLLASKTI